MLLERLGLPFVAVAPDTDETPLAGERPAATALRLAEAKARSVAGAHPDALIIGSDQVADCEGRPVGKPGTHERARSAAHGAVGPDGGLPHRALPARHGDRAMPDRARRRAQHVPRSCRADEIEAYLRRERPYDCAGSVRSEALGIALFERIESDDPTALIGLPLIRLTSHAARGGRRVLARRVHERTRRDR